MYIDIIGVIYLGNDMEKIVLAIIILVCIVIIGICIAKKRPDLIVDFCLGLL